MSQKEIKWCLERDRHWLLLCCQLGMGTTLALFAINEKRMDVGMAVAEIVSREKEEKIIRKHKT